MKKITFLSLLFISSALIAQVRGKITDSKNTPLAFVSIYLDKTINGTTSNDNGDYVLDLTKKGKYTIVFQFLGFKTKKKTIEITSFPYELNAVLEEENVVLDEISISTKENPANKIIRNTIAQKEKNTSKISKFTADFYSRGLFKTKNLPKKFLGQKLGDLGGGLDSTRSGIIYLSETVSKIYFQKKTDDFKEHIIASKVSGFDNGISFNQAKEVYSNLYNNQIEINFNKLFSPIADYAFGYYTYKLEGGFYDENGKLINKIKIIPKRKNDRVFNGYIYIVEDDWALYGADLTVTGGQINNPAIDVLHIVQNFKFSEKNNAWIQNLQTIDFKVSFLGLNFNGRFSASYSNYNFTPDFDKNTFNNEVISFEKDATKKDSVYWNQLRSVPLTKEEKKDYKFKDSIKIVRKSKKYLDSVDHIENKVSWSTPLFGYRYKNSYKKWNFSIDSPLKNLEFNTVQGWNTTVNLGYFKRLNDKGRWYSIKTKFNYGFSDKRLRPTGSFTYKWNSIDRPAIIVSGGVTTAQFNYRNPISNLYNTISSTLFKRNYLKIYEKSFANILFIKDVFNGIRLQSSLEYAKRSPLVNTTDYTFVNKKSIEYFSNDPRNPSNFSPSFATHSIWTADIGATINFDNKYMSYPDRKFNIKNEKYPSLFVGYRKTFGAKNSDLHSDFLYARLQQNISLGNVGEFKYNIRGGFFLEEKNIPFMDYAHPNGNKLAISPSNSDSTNHFNLLDYYTLSTNNKYTEMHIEHNFKGFVLGKIPLLNTLNFHLVTGAKGLFTGGNKPYSEYSIGLDNVGWGKWRFLRVDYIKSNFNGIKNDGIVIGINLLD